MSNGLGKNVVFSPLAVEALPFSCLRYTDVQILFTSVAVSSNSIRMGQYSPFYVLNRGMYILCMGVVVLEYCLRVSEDLDSVAIIGGDLRGSNSYFSAFIVKAVADGGAELCIGNDHEHFYFCTTLLLCRPLGCIQLFR